MEQKRRGLKSSVQDFYCPDTGGAHKSTEKIQLSIICSDLIAMVTEQWKILIKPATSKKMVESRDRGKTTMRDAGWEKTERGQRHSPRTVCACVFAGVCLVSCILMSTAAKVHDCPNQALNINMHY